MKAYAIVLERSKERQQYIAEHLVERQLDASIIKAVDGRLLSEEEIEQHCDAEQLEKLRWWLTNGAIGCALSHKKAYEAFLNTSDKCALILEDDVVLPANITTILTEIEAVIQPNELILLHTLSTKPIRLSAVGELPIADAQLHYLTEVKEALTATAYVVGRDCATGLLDANTPIYVTADAWHYFYEQQAIGSIRMLYPSKVDTKNFKSSIDYFNLKSMKQYLTDFINDYKIPILYTLLKKRRANIKSAMVDNVLLVSEQSPMQPPLH